MNECKIIGTENSIGIRMPNHYFLMDILEKTGPLLCTSANISNDIDPISIDCISKDLISNIYLIINEGNIKNGIPSTIIDITNKKWNILREGTIQQKDIQKIIKNNF